MNLWPNLTKNNYMKLHDKKNNFQKYEHIESVLMWGRGSDEKKELSFFIPAFRRMDTLKTTVESILQQDDVLNYEIIIVDNSGDTSYENLIYQYVKKLHNERISLYVNRENIGMIGNWNRGVEIAKTDYVAMLHDDDLLAGNYLNTIVKVITFARKKERFGFVKVQFADYYEQDSLPIIDDLDNETYLNKMTCMQSLFIGIGPTSCPTCGMIFSRGSFIDAGGFDELYYPSADYILGYQMIKYGYEGYILNKTLSYYRIGINESTKKDINIGFVMADYYFREYMYSEDKTRKLFGELFRNVQYTMSVDGLYDNAKRFGVSIEKCELDFRHNYGDFCILNFLFRVLRKIYFVTTSEKIIID